jgi:hypothetical protein
LCCRSTIGHAGESDEQRTTMRAHGLHRHRAPSITTELRADDEALLGEVGANLHDNLSPQAMRSADPANHPLGLRP